MAMATESTAAKKRPPVVLVLLPNDVLVGRGAPSIENEGNIRFRMLVESRKDEYMSTSKRQRKDWIARQVIQAVRLRGGRFLRRIESVVEAKKWGVKDGAKAWTYVDDDVILQKVKQSLRDRDIIDEKHKKESVPVVQEPAPVRVNVTEHEERVEDDDNHFHRSSASGIEPSGRGLSPAAALSMFARQQQEQGHGRGLPGVGTAFQEKQDRTILESFQGMRGLPDPTTAPGRNIRFSDIDFLLGFGQQSQLHPNFHTAPASGIDFPAQDWLATSAVSALFNVPIHATLMPPSETAVSSQDMMGIGTSRILPGNIGMHSIPDSSGMYAPAAPNLPQGMIMPSSGKLDLSSRQETSGDRAIRISYDRTMHGSCLSLLTDSNVGNDVRLSLIEMIMLSVACSHGLPVWMPIQPANRFVTSRKTGIEDDFVFTWRDFASLLTEAARDWYDSRRSMTATTPFFETAMAPSQMHLARRAIELSALYANDTEELAKKTVMLLEKIGRSAKKSLTSGRMIHLEQDGVKSWFETQLSHWAVSFNVADKDCRPLPYSSIDFTSTYSLYRDDTTFSSVVSLDGSACLAIFTQLSFMTRLRSVFLESDEALITQQLQKTLLEPDVAAWRGRPSWWGSNNESSRRSILLMRRLLDRGFLGILEERGFGPPSRLDYPTLRQLAVSKASIEEHMVALTCHLHRFSAELHAQAVLQERIERNLQQTASTEGGSLLADRSTGQPPADGTITREMKNSSDCSSKPSNQGMLFEDEKKAPSTKKPRRS